jgi:2-methylcitrate dehydratase
VALWQKVRTVEETEWDEKYHHEDPEKRSFGGRVVVTLKNGNRVEDEIDVPDAHPRGSRPFGRDDYLRKFHELAGLYATPEEQSRFLAAALTLPGLASGRLNELNVEIPRELLDVTGLTPGLFERHGQ